MPEVSRFYGIVIQMYVGDHAPPHFHARYAGLAAVIAIDDCTVLAGALPPRASKMVTEWAIMHRSDLEHDWELASRKLPLDRIEPLR